MNGVQAAAALAAAGFRGELRPDAPLAAFTTWRLGGPADLLATPSGAEDVRLALLWARETGTPWRVLGNGSNLLVRDPGVRGLVIRLCKVLDRVEVRGDAIVAGAGASFPAVARRAAEAGLAGLEFAAGIPGCVGGAVVMNAGWHEYETGARVVSVEILDADGTRCSVADDDYHPGYRTSALRGRGGVVLEARLGLQREDPGTVRERMDGFARSRRENQPTDQPSCGSVYLKPPGDFAGRLIDQAGLKGTRRGGIVVSPLHANFFVNTGSGTAADALALMSQVEEVVERATGVRLTREVEIW